MERGMNKGQDAHASIGAADARHRGGASDRARKAWEDEERRSSRDPHRCCRSFGRLVLGELDVERIDGVQV